MIPNNIDIKQYIKDRINYNFTIGYNGTPCWDWQLSYYKGYGQVGSVVLWELARHAHRLSWIVYNGPISNELCVCHHCDNRACCNPLHMFLGTNEDNNRDRNQKNRQMKGIDQNFAKMDDDKVREMRRLYALGGITLQKLGDMFGLLSTGSVHYVLKRGWKHVK